MAKSSKSDKTDRQATVDKMLSRQKAAERSRGFMIVGVAIAVAVLIVGAAAYKPLKDKYDVSQLKSESLSDLGAAASACSDITTKEATGNQQHVEVGTPLDIQDAPPAFGQHYNVWEPMDKKFYSASDRPELGRLIHNLEHGYTIVWYNEAAADDEETMDTLRAFTTKFPGTTNLRNKFIVAPWLDTDPGEFPEGKTIAYTHWSAGGVGTDATGTQVGVWQYCSEPSGEALETFMIKYPYMDSPEPTVV